MFKETLETQKQRKANPVIRTFFPVCILPACLFLFSFLVLSFLCQVGWREGSSSFWPVRRLYFIATNAGLLSPCLRRARPLWLQASAAPEPRPAPAPPAPPASHAPCLAPRGTPPPCPLAYRCPGTSLSHGAPRLCPISDCRDFHRVPPRRQRSGRSSRRGRRRLRRRVEWRGHSGGSRERGST